MSSRVRVPKKCCSLKPRAVEQPNTAELEPRSDMQVSKFPGCSRKLGGVVSSNHVTKMLKHFRASQLLHRGLHACIVVIHPCAATCGLGSSSPELWPWAKTSTSKSSNCRSKQFCRCFARGRQCRMDHSQTLLACHQDELKFHFYYTGSLCFDFVHVDAQAET